MTTPTAGALTLYALRPGLHAPAVGKLDLVVCAEHATQESADELLTDASRASIAEGLRRLGLAGPDWKRSFIRWVPIVHPEQRSA